MSTIENKVDTVTAVFVEYLQSKSKPPTPRRETPLANLNLPPSPPGPSPLRLPRPTSPLQRQEIPYATNRTNVHFTPHNNTGSAFVTPASNLAPPQVLPAAAVPRVIQPVVPPLVPPVLPPLAVPAPIAAEPPLIQPPAVPNMYRIQPATVATTTMVA